MIEVSICKLKKENSCFSHGLTAQCMGGAGSLAPSDGEDSIFISLAEKEEVILAVGEEVIGQVLASVLLD